MSDSRLPQDKTTASRRNFLKTTGAVTAGALAGSLLPAPASAATTAAPNTPFNPATAGAMPTRNLGRTGYRPGIFSLGGQAAIEQPNNEAAAVPIVEHALDLGVNYVDTAAMYGGKERWSQRYIGQVMKHRRSQVYLASETHDRTRDGSLTLLEESLKLLNTDHLDAWQLHHIDSKDEVDQHLRQRRRHRSHPPGPRTENGSLPRRHRSLRSRTAHRMPRRFDFDQILMAVNAADAHHRVFTEHLCPSRSTNRSESLA